MIFVPVPPFVAAVDALLAATKELRLAGGQKISSNDFGGGLTQEQAEALTRQQAEALVKGALSILGGPPHDLVERAAAHHLHAGAIWETGPNGEIIEVDTPFSVGP